MATYKKELKSFLAFDVETATSKRNSICQIGFSKVKDLQIVENKSFLIQPPENEYTAMNSCIHGITSLDTKDKPFFPDIWNEIKNEFKTNILVAHNASFDISALKETLNFYNLKIPLFVYVCTYQITNLSLQSLCESLSVGLEDHHNALADSQACAASMIKIVQGEEPDHSLIQKIEEKNPFEFKGHEKIKGDLLKPNLDVDDKDNPFYSKKVVLTGVLETMSRLEAAELLKSKGADIDTNVSKRTKFVIAGAGAGPSKLKKINMYNLEGAEIEILSEEEFICMIK